MRLPLAHSIKIYLAEDFSEDFIFMVSFNLLLLEDFFFQIFFLRFQKETKQTLNSGLDGSLNLVTIQYHST